MRTPQPLRRNVHHVRTHLQARAAIDQLQWPSCFQRGPAGYHPCMSKHRVLRAPVILVRPVHRVAWLLLLWTQRHSLALWSRSLITELRRGRPINGVRVRRLAVALFHVAADPRLSNAPELKLLMLTDDVVTAETDEHWAKRPLLTSVLTGVDHVNEVRFT